MARVRRAELAQLVEDERLQLIVHVQRGRHTHVGHKAARNVPNRRPGPLGQVLELFFICPDDQAVHCAGWSCTNPSRRPQRLSVTIRRLAEHAPRALNATSLFVAHNGLASGGLSWICAAKVATHSYTYWLESQFVVTSTSLPARCVNDSSLMIRNGRRPPPYAAAHAHATAQHGSAAAVA
eukprot:446088-Pleurochrysis_carterae.AAC.2